MNQSSLDRLHKCPGIDLFKSHFRLRVLGHVTFESTGNHAFNSGNRNGDASINTAQLIVEGFSKGMFDQTLHRTRNQVKIVSQSRCRWQVRRNNHLPGKRHIRTGKIMGLNQRMRHKTRLRPPRTVTKTKSNDWQIIITHKTRNTIIYHRHGKKSGCTLFSLHTSRGNKAHHRKLLLCTGY